ncbi:hypothetical protein IFM89_038478 [Coptis chinensis]|uniref:NmrA-like domain-containing protein n=1 Tax=Coptis chinensis TaxID=261450 RepID=A0A835H9Q6_9MAGN|nr:hypothetical protein IFM89_038478 [Coptis chinensis]
MAPTASPIDFEANVGRTLIVGATGFIGQFVVDASLASGRLTYVLVRSTSPSAAKAKTIKGSISNENLMKKALKDNQIEVVISVVGGEGILDQLSLRFLPSEFGHDVDRADPVEPGLTMYNDKRKVRRLIEDFGIPYTYICCNSIAAWPYHDNNHPSDVLPPMDQFQIYGDGSVKAYFVDGTDIGKFTVKVVDDARTINKRVHFRPPSNYLNINELANLWERKIQRNLPRVTITEDNLLDAAKENCIPQSTVASFTHDIFIKGCQTNFSVDGPNDVEASTLYPDMPFKTISECFDDFVVKIVDGPVNNMVNIVDNTVSDAVNRLTMTTCA